MAIRTSGGGNRDITMLTVPLAILVVFGILSGGGVESVLRSLERTLWVAVDWMTKLVS
jgi:hypothetical protein